MQKPTMCDSPAETETAPPSATTAVVVLAQSAELAHGVAWVVALTTGPDGWEAICWSQFAGVARWTWSHRSGKPIGNIWPLSSKVATNLTSERFMLVGNILRTPSAWSCPLVLSRWASARPIRTEDAAVSRLRPKNRSASGALVEMHAGVGWHRFGRLVSAVRAGHGRR